MKLAKKPRDPVAGQAIVDVRPLASRVDEASLPPLCSECGGIFIDAAMALVERAVPPPLPLQRERALAEAQRIMLANGLTAVADMGTSAEDWMTFRRAGDEGRLRMRIMSYASDVATMQLIGGPKPTALTKRMATITGWKLRAMMMIARPSQKTGRGARLRAAMKAIGTDAITKTSICSAYTRLTCLNKL